MNTPIGTIEVERIAALARLGLSEQEVIDRTQDITKILDHFSSIQKINTGDVSAYDNAAALTNIAREDVVEANLLCLPSSLLAAASETSSGHVRVQAVFT